MADLQEHTRRWQNRSEAPRFAPVDDDTASLLDLIADDGHVSVDHEWDLFKSALAEATDELGIVRQNNVRPLITGRIAPRRVGPFYRRACAEGLIYATDQWETSNDTHGRNSGRPVRIYRRVVA